MKELKKWMQKHHKEHRTPCRLDTIIVDMIWGEHKSAPKLRSKMR